MAQIIEVRFLNPSSNEELHDCFTKASSHEEAIQLALDDFSGGTGLLKSTEQLKAPQWVTNGASSAWKSLYRCVVEEDELEMLAVLFSQYK